MKTLLAALAFASVVLRLFGVESPVVLDSQHSRIEVDVNSTLGSFTGRVATYKSDILANTENRALTKVQFVINWADVKTGNVRRDRDLLAWEQYEQFPQMVYTMTSLYPLGENRYSARGQLILHGTAKEVVFPVTVTTTDGLVYAMDGEVLLDTQDFNLPPIRRYLINRVQPVVRVSFHLQGAVRGN